MSEETRAAIFGAVIGSVLTAVSSALVLVWQIKTDQRRRARGQRDLVNALLRALYHELDSVWRMYMSGSGAALEALPEVGAFMTVTPTAGEYFPVYLGNVTTLGLIVDAGLRDQIINTYTLGRSLIDGLMRNNMLLSDYLISNPHAGQVLSVIRGPTKDRRQLDQFGPLLKQCHNQCKAAIEALLPRLQTASQE